MSRIIDCPCGHQLRGANDEELFVAVRRHVIEHHPGMDLSDDQQRRTVRYGARDDVAGSQTLGSVGA